MKAGAEPQSPSPVPFQAVKCVLPGADFYGKVEITGTMQDADVSAEVRLEKAEKPEKVPLKRIAKPHG